MKETTNNKNLSTLLLVLFGLYLLLGAVYSLSTGKWFAGFPPVLDISMLFGNVLGIYVEAILALVAGAYCIYFAVHEIRGNNA
jgi:ABC-type transporter Mla subunit MlaD